MEPLARIPEPPETFLLGHLLTLSATSPVQDMVKIARELGPIYRLEIRGRVVIVVSGHELVDELSDEKRFDKAVRGALKLVRRFGGDGLFTSKTDEPNWSKAHNILMPNFSHKAMLSYHQMMLDIADQLVLKWERLNADEEIDVTHDMTSLTVDTIGLCGFDFRFNSFYHDKEHPFVHAMADSLGITMDELRDVPGENFIRQSRDRDLQDDINCMNGIVDDLIKDRRASGVDTTTKPDLLSYMLTGVDKKSGEKLDDVNIRYQVITFLIAGHETTSGMLSFAINALLQHPEVMAKAYEEVDRVLGSDLNVKPTYAQVNRLTYISQVLKETLRLWPTAPAYTVSPFEETVIGGKYKIKPFHQVTVLLPMLHRDKSVWGEDAENFNPDNFTPEKEATRPPNAYKPFGNGQRACIGRQFAMQEAALVLGMILQRFKLIDHTKYELKIKESLTMKPDNFRIRVRLRTEAERSSQVAVNSELQENFATAKTVSPTTDHRPPITVPTKHETPLLVLYGSNMGTAEELARRMAQDGEGLGFVAKVAPLDDYVGRLPKQGLVVVACASYNGLPPDNAVKFCDWLRSEERNPDELSGVKFAVFGCGNRDWAATFQAVPRFLDERLSALGAKRIYALGEGDAREDFDGLFKKWYNPARLAVAQEFGLSGLNEEAAKPLYKLEIVPGTQMSPFVDSLEAQPMKILVNRELVKSSDRSTRHIELELPTGTTYRAGDHLGVIPHNSEALVNRVLERFGFEKDSHIRLRRNTNRKTFLPVDQAISVQQLLSDYVEIQDVATRSQIQILADYTECPPHRIQLAALTGEDENSASRYREEILMKRQSVLDLFEEYAACTLPFEIYLEMLPALRPRYYSIASSPLVEANSCSITVAVVKDKARSGRGEFAGVCTNYLQKQQENEVIYAFVKDTKSSFRLPDDPATPIIMIGPGTGYAPFRGFLQERAALKSQGKSIGKSLIFFGCRHPEQDFLYEAELKELVAQEVTEMSAAFSRLDPNKKCYVQDDLYARRDEVWQLIEAGAVIYVCGDASRMAPDVRRTFAAIVSEKLKVNSVDAEKWMEKLTGENRYLVDVWASN